MQILFCFLCIVLSTLSSCNTATKRNPSQQKIKLNLYCEPPSLDSRKAIDTTSMNVLNMLFEGLMRIDENHQPQPAVAKEIKISEDGKTYLFYLKDSLWSNGDSVTAQDFIYAWEKILDPKYPADYAQKLFIIRNAEDVKSGRLAADQIGMRAINESTLEVQLENPTPYFLELLSFPTFFPIHRTTDQLHPNWSSDASSDFISNGPFQLKSWEHENELVLVKNPLYWDANNVKLEQIELTMVSDTSTELLMFERNELDWAGSPLSNLPNEVIPILKKTGNFVSYPIAAVYYYVFNVERFPFNNVLLRKAFALAIDRQSIIDHILQADQIAATSLVPPLFHPDFQQTYFHDGDRENAKKLFDQALNELNLSIDDFPTVTLSFNSNREHEKIAQAIQNQWLEVFGVSVELENFDWKVYLAKTQNHDFTIARLGWVGDFNDPIAFLQLYKEKNSEKGGMNATQWENEKYKHLLNQAISAVNAAERTKHLQQAETVLMEEMPIIPLYYITHSYLKKKYIKNVYLSPMGFVDFKNAYVDENDISYIDKNRVYVD